MKEIRAKHLRAIPCMIIDRNKKIDGFRVELNTEKTSTYILITKEEFMPVLEIFKEKNDKCNSMYI